MVLMTNKEASLTVEGGNSGPFPVATPLIQQGSVDEQTGLGQVLKKRVTDSACRKAHGLFHGYVLRVRASKGGF